MIEQISTGKPLYTIKAGQPIWPERTGENTAEDIAGRRYTCVDGTWLLEEDVPSEAA